MENQPNQKIINVEISKEMKKSYIDYAMSVIVGRALPDVRDGMKPVHRRILYTMHEAGLTPDKAYRKCADTVGSVLGKYHPHGDASVYDALVRMAQDFSLRYPIIDGHGNFGSVDGDSPAAYRYTEARMSKLSQFMLADIDKETVDYMPNYDDRLQEPTVLPSRIPNLLINGSSGIAVGMATNIPPHNITEVIDGVVAYIDDKEITIDGLMEHIKGPDFPTAGQILGQSGIRSAYHTGRGKITMRARAEIEETKNGKMQIIITELPYQVNKARTHEKIAELIKDKRIEGISDINDYSDRDGMRLVVDIKSGANANIVLNHLYKLTQLQETFGVINLALVDGRPKTLNLKEMISEYVKHQVEVIVRRCIFEKKKAEARAHILEGYRIALDHIDEVIKTIRAAYDNAKEQLVAKFGFTDIQAQAILDMQLKRLQGLEREKIDEEYNKLMALIEYLESVLASEEKQYQVVKDEIIAIRDKVGDERRTEIIPVSNEIDDEDLIPEEECVITLTQFGYIKRTTVDTYKVQNRGGRGVSGLATREEDFVKYMFTGSSHAYIMLFTDLGRVYNIRAFEVPESGRNAKGMNIVNLL
ncbi:MAG: DNA gyrase subunit A, partial [Oscillospiraceae bacterium]|nr:DNA gyrase subunit A [Oscillospiraceae bacterium]